MSEYKFHEFADLFPLLEGDEFAELVADIKANGLRSSIGLYEGKILDGRNRYRACLEAGIKPRFDPWILDGGKKTDEKALAYVISANLKRRHLSESQRAMVAAKIANMRQGARTDLSPIGETAVSQADAAGIMHVGKRSVERACAVLNRGTPELAAAVDSGKIKVSSAATVVRLPEAKQREAVAAGPKAVVAAGKRGIVRPDTRGGVTTKEEVATEVALKLTQGQILEVKDALTSLLEVQKRVGELPVPKLYAAIGQAANIAQGYIEEEIKTERALVINKQLAQGGQNK